MRSDYRNWLETQQYSANTIAAQIHRVGRVEECYGDLEEHLRNGTFQTVADELNYSTEDERRNKPNPSRIPIEGNTRNNLQSYKSAVVRYRRFLDGYSRPDSSYTEDVQAATGPDEGAFPDLSGQRLSLERDMQAALRQRIQQLGSTLKVIDDGAERLVSSGFIDITCRDESNDAVVVIELKAGKADSRAIGQVLGYMGDIGEEEPEKTIRGILVAHDFDKRSKAAARVVPSLTLVRYAVNFTFEREP